jgi:hypothetical protein
MAMTQTVGGDPGNEVEIALTLSRKDFNASPLHEIGWSGGIDGH